MATIKAWSVCVPQILEMGIPANLVAGTIIGALVRPEIIKLHWGGKVVRIKSMSTRGLLAGLIARLVWLYQWSHSTGTSKTYD